VNSTERFVDSADGERIAVYEQGNPDGPPLVLVHGWPDSHVLWDGIAPLLAERFRIIRYDNRGVGKSSVPKSVSSFTMARYADDFAAVLDAVAPNEKVHVLAHDWGSAGMWDYLARPEAAERVASFTSSSGPSADHLNRYVLDGLARPYRPGRFLRSLATLLRLSYMGMFSIPVVAPLLVRTSLNASMNRTLRVRDGIPANQIHHSDTFVDDAVASMKVYPANFFKNMVNARADHYVDVPVQLIVNTEDPFVRHHVYDDITKWCSRLWRRDVKAGHWSVFSHPQVIAQSVTELVDHLAGAPASRQLLRAQVGRPRDPFGDTLVSVTGAGSGIGRETALAFARQGAELVVSDVDEASVKETAAQLTARGSIAHAYVLDVSDADAVEAFAEQVCAAHGVPDVVVNNAGIGQAGSFLDTPADQWDRVLDVNLGGVVNGCRSFAKRLVARGTGGHIVNVASMAAYAPLQAMNAYCTSKAAVYMFSDCLRAELDAAGVGLTTICPGVINTNIVATTRWDPPPGKSGQVAGRRKQVEAAFAARRYGPDKVAKAIVSAVTKNKAVRPVAPEAYLLYGTSRIAPQVLRSTARGKLL
jgi:NAD(P)-dependent dehydrogenase (short-subunit alcohol dehydrogenase family)/pimeloyl-ACP methyl ester carboxylesterase